MRVTAAGRAAAEGRRRVGGDWAARAAADKLAWGVVGGEPRLLPRHRLLSAAMSLPWGLTALAGSRRDRPQTQFMMLIRTETEMTFTKGSGHDQADSESK